MEYITDYPHLCDKCQAIVKNVVDIVAEGADSDDEEAPINFVYDNAMFCSPDGYICINHQ